jgi:3-isopropylmalate/(R)-2-methylmalate dehydratase small subunit
LTLADITGRVAFVFEEANFDVDQIVGPENINERDLERLCQLAMRDYDPAFAAKVRPGDVLVANGNFGYGHPHYPPMIAMRRLGIQAVIAESFAPGYWREEMEEGFPQITCPGIVAAVRRWDRVTIDFAAAQVRCARSDLALPFVPFTANETALLAAGGLLGYLKGALTDDARCGGGSGI